MMISMNPLPPRMQRSFIRNKAGPSIFGRTGFGIRHVLLCAAFVVLIFSNDEGGAVLFQILGVMLFSLSAAMFFLSTPGVITLAPIDGVILFSVALSYLAGTFSQDAYSLGYTTVFLVAYVSVIVITQRTTAEELVATIRLATVAILVLVAVTFGDTLLTSLMPGSSHRWELREAPFGMHPNLAGFVYGGFLVIAANSGMLTWRYNKILTPAIIAFCLAIMTVASARGGLVAVMLALAVYIANELTKGKRSIGYVLAIGTAVIVLSAIYWRDIVSYATEMFDLDSQQRGLESGGTGRFEIWHNGIDYIASRSWQVFIGSGFRTAGQMGFPVESSYINLAIESGIFMVVIVLVNFLSILLRSYRKQTRGSSFHRLAFYTLLFALFQSIFNRYLIAIGNPFSLMILLIASKASPRLRTTRASLARPGARGWTGGTPALGRSSGRMQS
jgi:exopolysaccharide production protein ExoQ